MVPAGSSAPTATPPEGTWPRWTRALGRSRQSSTRIRPSATCARRAAWPASWAPLRSITPPWSRWTWTAVARAFSGGPPTWRSTPGTSLLPNPSTTPPRTARRRTPCTSPRVTATTTLPWATSRPSSSLFTAVPHRPRPPPWTWTHSTGPAAALRWWRSTIEGARVTAASTGMPSRASGASPTSRTASTPCATWWNAVTSIPSGWPSGAAAPAATPPCAPSPAATSSRPAPATSAYPTWS